MVGRKHDTHQHCVLDRMVPAAPPVLFVAPRLLGDEIGTIHSRKELNELLKIHVQHGAIDVETGREVAGAMNYKECTVREVMTPVKDCFMLSVSEKLNFKVLSLQEKEDARSVGSIVVHKK